MQLGKHLKLSPGIVVCLLLIIIPTFGWMFGYDFGEFGWQDIAITLAKVGAFGGAAAFAVSLILSGRYIFLEKMFGGLDKMYIAHRSLGALSMLLILLHPLALTAVVIDSRGIGAGASLWLKLSDVGILLGGIALYLFVVLILVSVYVKMRYETFLTIHRYLGITFIIGMFHAFLAGSVLASQAWLYWYMLVLTTAATLTFVSYSILHDLLHPALSYRVVSVHNYHSHITEVILKPKTRIMRFSPGQFVYVQFKGLEGTGYHPFSIASGDKSSNLRLVIRQSGDFTKNVHDLKVGTKAKVKGPHGGFVFNKPRSKKQLWIAGGIGVAPFLSGAHSLPYHKHPHDIQMIYATADKKPYGMDELEKIKHDKHSFHVTLTHEDTFGHINLKMLHKNIKDLEEREIYVCGPPPMLKAITAEARKLGLENRLHYEEFSY